MKTKILPVITLIALLSGCANLSQKFDEFERLGIVQADITGKFSHTEYTVTVADGKRRAVIVHSNVWIPSIKVVRETPAK